MILYSAELKGRVVEDADGVAREDVLWCDTITGRMLQDSRWATGQPFVAQGTPPLRVVDPRPGFCPEPADSEAKVDAAVEAALEAIRKSPHQAEFEAASTNLLEACIRVAEMVSPHPSFEKTESLVIQWGADRGILEHSNARAQLLKTMAELGELADAEGKNDTGGIVDGIGDVLVTLILYATLRGLDVSNCLALAYDEIKDRKGKMVEGGTFVKEAQA